MPPNFYEQASAQDDFDIRAFFHAIWGWILRTLHAINDETLAHPYYIVLALLVVCAWPHILALPVWFGKDAYRRMERQTRHAVSHVVINPPPKRKRDVFISRYRAIIGSADNRDQHPPLFGGTPLSDGNFTVEQERSLPIYLRIIRWSCLSWAVFILGREAFFFYVRQKW